MHAFLFRSQLPTDAARNARMPGKSEQKKGRKKDRRLACEIEKAGGRRERREETGIVECIIAALKALRTRVSRERLLAAWQL